MFAPFSPGAGWLHRLPPAVKLLALALTGTGLFLLDDPRLMMGVMLAVLSLFPLAGLPLSAALAQVRPVALIGGIIILVQIFVGGPGSALLVGARLIALLLLAGLVTLTTRTTDMIATLEHGLHPLSRVGVNPAKTALALSLAVRFVPMTAQIVGEVREAQRVRALEHNLLALAVPTLVRALKLTDDIADAIEARGFDPDKSEPDKGIS